METQAWITIGVYVLVAILKKELNLPASLQQTLQILSANPSNGLAHLGETVATFLHNVRFVSKLPPRHHMR